MTSRDRPYSPKSNPEGTRPEAGPPPEALPRLAYRLTEVARALGVSRRTLERERSAGRFPTPDLQIGKAPLWLPATLRDWAAKGGGRP